MTARKSKAVASIPEKGIPGIKGYNKDLKCRGFQFEIGKSYEHDGPVIICSSGFHAVIGYPLEVFSHYPPAGSRYTMTTQSGKIVREDEDSKAASAKITIGVEVYLHEITQCAVKWVFDRAKPEGETATGYQGAAMGANGNAVFLVYRDPKTGRILHAWAGIVGRDGVKPLTWYRLDATGKPLEIETP